MDEPRRHVNAFGDVYIVTNAVMDLVSDGARYVTGTTLPVEADFAVM